MVINIKFKLKSGSLVEESACQRRIKPNETIDLNCPAPEIDDTYYVEIEYSDGTIIKHGLDTRTIDGDTYYLESDDQPECFMDIISKTSLFE